MDHRTLRREQRRARRLRTLGTNNPFCRVCGKSKWWAYFQRHHIDGHRLFEDLIMVCGDCHNEVHEMLKDLDPLPPGMDPDRAALIHRLEGQNALAQMQIVANERTIKWLMGSPNLPPLSGHDNENEV